ncbi:MAG TPA: DUF2306 domain-containing protein [Limnobacter sp.]|nr:DUF2306 domain-containing protein [Limnobacter sp.]
MPTTLPKANALEPTSLLKHFFILNVIVWMGLAGWISLLEGTTRFMLPFQHNDAAEMVQQAVEQARSELTLESLRAVSEELWALASLTSAERFINSRLPEHGLFYATMPRANQVLMLVHVVLASFCMLLGGLQFWPAFRKRFMRAHRAVGALYILTVPPAIVAVMVYMALTAPHNIYDHLLAWIALWVFATLALVSIAMAVRALRAKRIFEHQAWMALSFGCLAVAPFLRLNWVFLAWIFPDIDQETLNLVTLSLMLPQTLLLAWGLVMVNRQFERRMIQRKPTRLAQQASALFMALKWPLTGASLMLLLINAFWALSGGTLATIPASANIMPQGFLLAEAHALANHRLALSGMVIGLGAAFPLAVRLLLSLLQTAPGAKSVGFGHESTALVLTAMVGGLGSMAIGNAIGLQPDRTLLSGGAMWWVNGLCVVFFGGLTGYFLLKRQAPLAKEMLVFLLCILPFPALFLTTSAVAAHLPWSAVYLEAGQGLIVPAGFSGGLLFLAALHMVFSQATREYN